MYLPCLKLYKYTFLFAADVIVITRNTIVNTEYFVNNLNIDVHLMHARQFNPFIKGTVHLFGHFWGKLIAFL